MRKLLKSTALAALLVVSLSAAQAATQFYSFSGSFDTNPLTGYSGEFSFDDIALTSVGLEYLGVDSLGMSFLGGNWGLGQALADTAVEVKFVEGVFAGLSYSASLNGVGFTTVPGFADVSDSFAAVSFTPNIETTGSMIYAAVPEPETYALLLAGLAMMGAVARRRKA